MSRSKSYFDYFSANKSLIIAPKFNGGVSLVMERKKFSGLMMMIGSLEAHPAATRHLHTFGHRFLLTHNMDREGGAENRVTMNVSEFVG